MSVPIIIILTVLIAAFLGVLMAKLQLKKDVAILYSTRPLSTSQIDKLNIELKGLRKAELEAQGNKSS
ncbi:MAG: hypothetical protein KDD94_06125 [Calditrichaeota bacterium]|nr:hypothetical protein [Calditrichota bacterium]